MVGEDMKIIGASFGRTGTLSLKYAIEKLGLGPCYHMEEVLRHPTHVARWQAVFDGEPPNWEKLFGKFQSTVDWPGCRFYQELMEAYPEAKVILTVRDPDRWYQSAYETIFNYGNPQLPILRYFFPPMLRFMRMIDASIWDGTFNGRFADKAYAISLYNSHIEEVKRHVPAERLLVYSVKEGWEPLCEFLGVPVPTNAPFPHVNSRASMQRRLRWMRLSARAVPTALVGLIGYMLYLFWGS